MNLEEYRNKYDEEDAVGWDIIEEELDKIYPEKEYKHYASIIPYALGGEEPLDGVSIYKSEKEKDHYHFVSFGMSDLYYNEESISNEYSGWGFEFTFRLVPFEEDDDEPTWVVSLMQNLAKYVYKSKNWFDEYHFIPANGPIRLNTDTDITGIAFVLDPELGKIDTVHGELKFLQMVGITESELNYLRENPSTDRTKKLLEELKKKSPLLISDLKRK